MPLDVPLPSKFFSREANGRDKNSGSSAKSGKSLMLSLSISSNKPSNSLFRPFSFNGK